MKTSASKLAEKNLTITKMEITIDNFFVHKNTSNMIILHGVKECSQTHEVA